MNSRRRKNDFVELNFGNENVNELNLDEFHPCDRTFLEDFRKLNMFYPSSPFSSMKTNNDGRIIHLPIYERAHIPESIENLVALKVISFESINEIPILNLFKIKNLEKIIFIRSSIPDYYFILLNHLRKLYHMNPVKIEIIEPKKYHYPELKKNIQNSYYIRLEKPTDLSYKKLNHSELFIKSFARNIKNISFEPKNQQNTYVKKIRDTKILIKQQKDTVDQVVKLLMDLNEKLDQKLSELDDDLDQINLNINNSKEKIIEGIDNSRKIKEIFDKIKDEDIRPEKFLERILKNMKGQKCESQDYEDFFENFKIALEESKDISFMFKKTPRERIVKFLKNISRSLIGVTLSDTAENIIEEIICLIRDK